MDRKTLMRRHRDPSHRLGAAALRLAFGAAILLFLPGAGAQDNIFTGTNSGATQIRIAVADFKAAAVDPQSSAETASLKQTFDSTLYADLATAGIFDIVSKSLMPPGTPGSPAEMQVQAYASAPAGAAMVVFGSIGLSGGKLVTNGYLFDAKNLQYPQVVAKQYSDDPTEDAARQDAHRFADEIILRLGGGTPGIAESKIYYRQTTDGKQDIWEMDYDGANQHPVTHLGTSVMSPRISPDGSRLAFATFGRYGFQLKMYSMLLGRYVSFPSGEGSAGSPAWAPSGNEIAYTAAPNGHFDIWIADSNGNLGRRITSLPGGSVSPAYNPKTGAQIAFISGRTGLPQMYIMNSDGSGIQPMTDGGYASSPSWSPNGQVLAFAWDRKYGPGAPGGQDIYVMEVSSKYWQQLTRDDGRCDFPSWSPDGRHIVYANSADGRPEHVRIWTMLADGTQKRPLTGTGADMPNWSWK